MNIEPQLQSIIGRFAFPGELVECEPIKAGHINRTYRLRFALEAGRTRDYVLQRINTFAFKKPVEVMSNVSAADAEQAYELSLERSNALKEALSKLYIDPSRVVASGYGNVNFKRNSSVKPVEIVFFEE